MKISMIIADVFKEVFWSLSANKTRSGLTVLGIVIGIASVITMVSIGQGAQTAIQSNIEAIGSNLIMITPGAQRGSQVNQGRGSAQTLTLDDATALTSEVQGIKAIAADVTKRYQITAKGTNTNTSVTGTLPAYLAIRNITMDTGSFFNDRQEKVSEKVAVLGPTARDDLFGINSNPIGQTIRIGSNEFTVIGITKTKGGSGFSNPDNIVYVPISTAQHFLSGDNLVSTISVAATDQNSMLAVQEQITSILLRRHNIYDPTQADFSILNQNDIISTASSITGTFTILLSSIAGISLLVGGIGIMNMMLTTVTERTREIGLRKAVGVKKKYINLQFLMEAVVLTFFGGVAGVLLGWGASLAVSKFAGLTTQVSLSSVGMAFGVATAVGIVFGFYPAQRAANLKPIDALRYE